MDKENKDKKEYELLKKLNDKLINFSEKKKEQQNNEKDEGR